MQPSPMQPSPSQPSTEQRFAAAIAELARPADIRALHLPVLHVVMTLRLCALFERAGRDPLAELSTRFGNISAARQMLRLAEMATRVWPERYMTARPCCTGMTPDERTMANLARAAMNGDRAAFGREITGFIKPDWHDPLYDQTVRTVAELSALGNWKASRQPL